MTVRRLAEGLHDDLDAALVAVGRGEFPGVRFELADADTLKARQADADRAHLTKTRVSTGRGRVTIGG